LTFKKISAEYNLVVLPIYQFAFLIVYGLITSGVYWNQYFKKTL